MRNILSLVKGTPIYGFEIKEWINYNIENETSHTLIANRMRKYLNINDNKLYRIVLSPFGTGCGEIRKHHPIVIKVS